ncbi:MAG: dienelactone hydrolase family protein [Acidobacteria bacterium]|nr:dienelactone hydrolase family protein [Acidobacteriota bacterium]MBI3655794.1 dienelactone hydrolase family protein [Acidobacteriota bacterium]
MEKQIVIELSEKFRKGLINRRDFIQKVILSTGSVVAAGHTLSQMGFEVGLIQEAKAQGGGDIIIEEVTYPSANQMIRGYLAKPAQGGPFPTMIVIHEIFGLSDFIKDVARLFARRGYLALAPCLSEGNCADDLPDGKHAQWMLDTLQSGEARVPLDEQDKLIAGFNWLAQRSDVDPTHIGSVGFCWGGARSFTLATRLENLWTALVFYGSTPPLAELDTIKAPVLALYGGLDNASPTSITGRAAETARAMRDAKTGPKIFEWEIYNQAPHGFFADRETKTVAVTRAALIAKDLMFDFLDRQYDRP